MADTYLEIREQLEEAIVEIAAIERELGTAEELIDPIKALKEGLHSPFCLVVLGEKGSGKSSLLNAFAREDLANLEVVEEKIKVFRHGERESDRLIADDLEECARPLPFLRNFTLIDTPANLLLGDARLLTRDIFPIADLVLCVFSVGNPWAPSTWEFLRNAKKEWLTKVVFVVQQADLRDREEAKAVSRSLAAHAEQALGVAPVLFEISAKQAQDEQSRQESGIVELERFIEERTAASHAHLQKARHTCKSARGPLIDIAERVRGTLYLANLEKSKIDQLVQILDECKERSMLEVKELVNHVADCYLRNQAKGEDVIKSKLTLLTTVKSAFTRNDWELSFQEEVESQVRTLIAKATESIKSDLLASSKRFLESSIFSKQEDQETVSQALGTHGKQLADNIKKTLARNRTEGLEDTMNEILDAAGSSIRWPVIFSGIGLVTMIATYSFPMIFGLASAATAVVLALTLMVVIQKHSAIVSEYHLHLGQKRERAINTIDRQITEAVNTFCEKHKVLIPPSTFSDSARQRLEPFVPRIKSLEDKFTELESKLDELLNSYQ